MRLHPSVKIMIEDGSSMDLESMKSLRLPSLRTFKFVRYYKEQSKRWSQMFLCEHENCDKSFKKWHNLFDHLRSHTHERPFACPVLGCSQPFSQRSNLNKHMKIHKNKCYLTCSICKQQYTRAKILKHFNTHRDEEDLCDQPQLMVKIDLRQVSSIL